ncbi:hypothetical protein [Azospirillum baldaniorum]|uniref:hypothetical protein n=1 Tax=Azospirillum baldaniorum TaxID=1064539 RepID=UPI00157AB617|nr:hypothetical protein [Azospirillum baldaniorum]
MYEPKHSFGFPLVWPSWSFGHGGQHDFGIIAERSDGFQRHAARAGKGWSAPKITVNGNAAALQETFGTRNMQVGSSPYTGDDMIIW